MVLLPHTTSLASQELRLVHEIYIFSVGCPSYTISHDLRKQLHSFSCVFPPPQDLQCPLTWLRQYDDGAALLHRAVIKVQLLPSRRGTLELLPPPQLQPMPQAQSALLRLPAELRAKIFEDVVKHDDWVDIPVLKINGYHNVDESEHRRTTALLQVCRQTRHEAIQPFFELNTFVFDIRYYTSQNPAPGKWLTAVSDNPRSLQHLVFVAPYCDKNGLNPTEWISVSINWSSDDNQWSVGSTDDYSLLERPDERGLFVHSIKLLSRILKAMLDQRTPAYLTASYLFWFVYDLKRFYYSYLLLECAIRWNAEAREHLNLNRLSGPPPAVARPTDMYTADLEMRYLGQKLAKPGLEVSLEIMKQEGITEGGIRQMYVMHGLPLGDLDGLDVF